MYGYEGLKIIFNFKRNDLQTLAVCVKLLKNYSNIGDSAW